MYGAVHSIILPLQYLSIHPEYQSKSGQSRKQPLIDLDEKSGPGGIILIMDEDFAAATGKRQFKSVPNAQQRIVRCSYHTYMYMLVLTIEDWNALNM